MSLHGIEEMRWNESELVHYKMIDCYDCWKLFDKACLLQCLDFPFLQDIIGLFTSFAPCARMMKKILNGWNQYTDFAQLVMHNISLK